MNFPDFSDAFSSWVNKTAQLIQNELQADLAGLGGEVTRSGVIVRGHVQRAFFATAVVAFIYYVVEPYFGIGQTQVEGLLFLPLFLDFGVYTLLQFIERLAEPFVSWAARKFGLVWLYYKVSWVIRRPLGWLFQLVLAFIVSFFPNQTFKWPAFPTGNPQSAVSPGKLSGVQAQWSIFQGNVRRAFAETAVTVAMYFAFSAASGMNQHESFEIMVALPLYLQVFRYTMTQFFARVAEPYVMQLAAPTFPAVRVKLLAWGDAALIGLQRCGSATLHFLLDSAETKQAASSASITTNTDVSVDSNDGQVVQASATVADLSIDVANEPQETEIPVEPPTLVVAKHGVVETEEVQPSSDAH